MKKSNTKLLVGIVGSLAGMLVGGMTARQLGNTGGIFGKYGEEIAGGAVVASGIAMMSSGDANLKNAGFAMSTVGGALASKGIYQKVKSGNLISLPGGNNENTTGDNGNAGDNMGSVFV